MSSAFVPADAPQLSPQRLQRARFAVAALFLTNGALFANLLPHYPAIIDDLQLSNAQFGVAVASFPLGAIIAGLASGVLVRRFRSSRVATAGTWLIGVAILLAGIAPSWLALVATLFVAGAMDAVTDVAQNSHGLRVQRLYNRSILNSFHAVWSIGAVLGGLMGAAAAGLDIPRGLHLAVSLVVFSALTLTCYRYLLPGPEPVEVPEAAGAPGQNRRAARGAPAKYFILAALVLIAAAGALVEDAGSSWAAVYLSGPLEASATVAGLGFVALTGMQFIGRMFGDRLVDRFGQRLVAQAGGTVAAAGMGTALLFPSVAGTITGFGLAGLGVATLVPAAMHTADELPGLRAGTGLTVISWLMRLGFLLSPPVVGAVADTAGLRTGLLVIPLAGAIVLAVSPALASRARANLPEPALPEPLGQRH
ncbi:Inner membrane protein YbjJ [Arthrobacter sp. Bi83]|uniref:MFS transporter n=1 Tax=Arthrobacter sp. Bi83 TaxID=2822353 RepID=UPI001D9622DA|nr:MFS transporter [Arthrobacter sp. Bi83]CAH0298873.1 Inner membrane protein YbjJ [Arthrobacter sp. Bi83]